MRAPTDEPPSIVFQRRQERAVGLSFQHLRAESASERAEPPREGGWQSEHEPERANTGADRRPAQGSRHESGPEHIEPASACRQCSSDSSGREASAAATAAAVVAAAAAAAAAPPRHRLARARGGERRRTKRKGGWFILRDPAARRPTIRGSNDDLIDVDGKT